MMFISLVLLLLVLPGGTAGAVQVSLVTPHRELTLFSLPDQPSTDLDFTLKYTRTTSIPAFIGNPGWPACSVLQVKISYPAKPLLPLNRIDYGQAIQVSLKDFQDRIEQLEKSKKIKRKYSYERDHLYVKPRLGNLDLGRDWELAHSVKHRLDSRCDLLLFINSYKYWNGVMVLQAPALLETRLRSVSLFVVQSMEKRGWRHSIALGGGLHDIGLMHYLTQLNRIYRSSYTVSTYEMFWKAERGTSENDYLAFEIRSRKGNKSFTADPVAHTVTTDFDNTYYGVGYNFFFPLVKYLEYIEESSKKLEKMIF